MQVQENLPPEPTFSAADLSNRGTLLKLLLVVEGSVSVYAAAPSAMTRMEGRRVRRARCIGCFSQVQRSRVQTARPVPVKQERRNPWHVIMSVNWNEQQCVSSVKMQRSAQCSLNITSKTSSHVLLSYQALGGGHACYGVKKGMWSVYIQLQRLEACAVSLGKSRPPDPPFIVSGERSLLLCFPSVFSQDK
jgi:hypothetical protein